jgi:hypothetical protein
MPQTVGHLDIAWRKLAELIHPLATPVEIANAKSLFYSGAMACYEEIASASRRSGEVGRTMVMFAIHGEISEFQTQMLREREKGGG